MNALLRKYIREIVLEVRANPAVANQLPGTPRPGEKEKKDKEEDEVEELDEFSGAGAIAGFTAPLGLSGQDVEGPGSRGERKKRKKPGWT